MESLLLIFSLSFLSSVAVADPLEDSRYENAKPTHVVDLDKRTDAEYKESIHYAVIARNLQAIQRLVNEGADVNAKNEVGWTALQLASLYGYDKVAKLLIKNGAKVDAKDKAGWTALHHASWNGQLRTSKLLVAEGADVNAKTDKGWAPLHYAVFSGERAMGMIDFLLKNGAYADVPDGKNLTPLQLAKEMGYQEMVIRLKSFQTKAKSACANSF